VPSQIIRGSISESLGKESQETAEALDLSVNLYGKFAVHMFNHARAKGFTSHTELYSRHPLLHPSYKPVRIASLADSPDEVNNQPFSVEGLRKREISAFYADHQRDHQTTGLLLRRSLRLANFAIGHSYDDGAFHFWTPSESEVGSYVLLLRFGDELGPSNPNPKLNERIQHFRDTV
jgi:hypothetical protein